MGITGKPGVITGIYDPPYAYDDMLWDYSIRWDINLDGGSPDYWLKKQ